MSVTVPANVSDLTVAGKTLWAANYVSKSPSQRLWSSTDGHKFNSLPMKDQTDDSIALLIRSQIVIAGSQNGELFVAHLIDAPVIHRVFPLQSKATWPIAYSRSRSRATLVLAEDATEDLTLYSSPVRDMIAMGTELIVLRNREDIRMASGVVTQQGIRVDRYASDGRHLASATFAEPMKWILNSNAQQVAGIARNGIVRVAKWGKPIAGGIVQ